MAASSSCPGELSQDLEKGRQLMVQLTAPGPWVQKTASPNQKETGLGVYKPSLWLEGQSGLGYCSTQLPGDLVSPGEVPGDQNLH